MNYIYIQILSFILVVMSYYQYYTLICNKSDDLLQGQVVSDLHLPLLVKQQETRVSLESVGYSPSKLLTFPQQFFINYRQRPNNNWTTIVYTPCMVLDFNQLQNKLASQYPVAGLLRLQTDRPENVVTLRSRPDYDVTVSPDLAVVLGFDYEWLNVRPDQDTVSPLSLDLRRNVKLLLLKTDISGKVT